MRSPSMLFSNLSMLASISALTMGWDFLMVLTSWSLCLPTWSDWLPWITHSGQIHSHLQSKQKYRISYYGCYRHYLLDDMPVNCLSVLAKVAGFHNWALTFFHMRKVIDQMACFWSPLIWDGIFLLVRYESVESVLRRVFFLVQQYFPYQGESFHNRIRMLCSGVMRWDTVAFFFFLNSA